jgi:hypothetical protein
MRLPEDQVRKWATTRSERSEAGSMARELLELRALRDAVMRWHGRDYAGAEHMGERARYHAAIATERARRAKEQP